MSYPKPLGYYTQPENRPLLFHLLDVGEGLMILLIFPDETTMLYDCNVLQSEKEEIIDYLGMYIPPRYDPEQDDLVQWIDIFVNSHRDLDHYRGLAEVNSVFEIKSIWDSGETGQTTQDADYQYYMRLRRRLIERYGEGAVLIPAPSYYPVQQLGMASVFCLSSSRDFVLTKALQLESVGLAEKAKIQHTNAIVLSIQYAGRSILLTSDSDWKAWKEDIVPNFGDSGLLKATILVASHHGSRSFFTDEQQNEHISPDENPDTTCIESMDYIDPCITLISCGDYGIHHHPNEEALEIYKQKTPHQWHKQVYTTYDKGTFAGFVDQNGNWTVCPSRFFPTNTGGSSFELMCSASYNDHTSSARSGDRIPIGSQLEFSVRSHGGTIDPPNFVRVWWEVSNGGINQDHDHQEIYYKGEHEAGGKFGFNRSVAYEGKHLLRCRLNNRRKGIDITKVFVVNGIK